MKLELKHLASYLPYGMKVQINFRQNETIITDNWGLKTGSDYPASYYEGCKRHGLMMSQIKPILRPLSDLTKEIDGVVHLDIIKEIYPNVPNFYSLLRTKTLDLFALCDTIVEYCVVQYLFQHHFDVYGLIDKGLAIDINTIES